MDTTESFPDLVKKMEQQIHEMPGKVIVKQTIPILFVAIVYDVEHTPISKESWIEEALRNILMKCDKYKIKTLAMPLLGTSYGKLKEETSMQLLLDSLNQNRDQTLKKVLIYKNIN